MRTDFSAVLTPRPFQATEGTFIVGPWQVALDATPQGIHRQPGLLAVLKGQLYDLDGAGLLQLYRQHGLDAFRRFDGAFSLLLLDEAAGTFLAVTDRMGTHKLYTTSDGGCVTVSTRPDHPDFTRRPYRLGGLASVMVSGSLMNNLTLYEGVRSLDAASAHELRPEGLESQVYWQPQSAGALDARPEAELREEFAELLRRAVRRRVEGLTGPVHLSLSGGHDSRGLLSLLTGTGQDVRTFSYTQGPQAARSDIRMADALAAQYGTQHQHVQAYRGDLLATLRRNAQWGRGVANFCDEADAWDTLAHQPVTDLFAGEQIHEIYGHRLHDVSEQLTKRHVRPFSTLGSLAGRLDAGTARALEDAWTAEVEQIRSQVSGFDDPYRQDFTLVTRQLVRCRLLPWRERFAGRFAGVHLPYLDAAVMDFVYRLPPEFLVGKRLFIDTLRELDPALYQVPLAQSQGYETDWHAELIKHREAVKEELLSGSSHLDAVIDPQVIRTVLNGLAVPDDGGRAKLTGQVRQALGTFRHSDLGQKILGQARVKAPMISPATWLMRVLTLRALDAQTNGN